VAKSNDSFPRWAETGFGTPRRELARWFRANARDLPWRRGRSVYRTVVSEFMLQQTRVTTVLPYFERWMEAFPDFAALAAAEEREVLALWQGLGYYSRARNLHKLARRVAEEGAPSDAAGWKALPGVGDYTAAAVASIAQGVSAAVVDGNVVRVLARLSADGRTWGSSGEAVRGYAPTAAAFLDRSEPGLHNEALMELGALVCLPRAPLCTVCPLVGRCGAAARGLADSLPRVAKAKKTERTVRRAWSAEGGAVLLRETPDGSKRLAGLLELPALGDLPPDWRPDPAPFARRRRGIGNESITEWFHSVAPGGDPPPGSGLRRVPVSDLPAEPLSGPHRRWIEEFLKSGPL